MNILQAHEKLQAAGSGPRVRSDIDIETSVIVKAGKRETIVAYTVSTWHGEALIQKHNVDLAAAVDAVLATLATTKLEAIDNGVQELAAAA